MVVGKNLGADSLQRWLGEQGFPTTRLASAKGFRVLETRRARQRKRVRSSRLSTLWLGPSGSASTTLDRARVLVPAEPLARPGDQLVGVEPARRAPRTTTAQISSPFSASGHADHRDLGDRGVAHQHLLDLARVDVEAAADDQVLLAVDDAR